MNATNMNAIMLRKKRLNSSRTSARYGAKTGTSGIIEPSKVLIYPVDEAIVTAVVVL